jgi:hypothetical protein
MVRHVRRWAVVFLLGAAAGCPRKDAPPSMEPAQGQLYKIGQAFVRASARLGRAPAHFADLEPDLPGASEDILRSPGDGEPFVILWGIDYNKLPPAPKDPFTVGGYEKHGVSGSRWVLRFPLSVVRLSDADLKKAVFPPGHGPP